MRRSTSGLNSAQRTLIAVLVVVSITATLATSMMPISVVRLPPLIPTVCLAMFGLFAESRKGQMRGAKGLSLTTIAMLAALPLAGLFGSVVVAFCSTALVPTRVAASARLFNTATITLCASIGALGYSVCAGASPIKTTASANAMVIHVLAPLVVAMILHLAVNVGCVGCMITLASGQPLRSSLHEVAANVWTLYPAYAVIAFVLAVLWAPVDLGPVSFLPIVAPLLIAQWSIELRAQEYEAHLRTLETLVAAGQAGQSMLRGRSVLVEAVAREIGSQLRLSSTAMQSLQHAALLQDIGLIAPASRSPGVNLTSAERDWILSHPRQGMRMLDGIEFLSEARRAAEHHHERWDGRGYPDGLSQLRIPLLARILSVANAYCALILADAVPADADVSGDGFAATAERSLAAVSAESRTQFDPAIVEALRSAHPRVVEVCRGLVSEDSPAVIVGVDPHLPWVSQMFADPTATNTTTGGR